MHDENQNELFTWVVKAGANRIYYLNVKQDRNGQLYLVVKESTRELDGSKKVHRIMVFEKDLQKFVEGLKKTLEFISNQGLDLSEPPADSENYDDNRNLPTEESTQSAE